MNKIKNGFKIFIAIVIVLGSFNSVTAMEEEKTYKVISKEQSQKIYKDLVLREQILLEQISRVSAMEEEESTVIPQEQWRKTIKNIALRKQIVLEQIWRVIAREEKEKWKKIFKNPAFRERLLREKIRELIQYRKNQCTGSVNATRLDGFLHKIGCPPLNDVMIVDSYFQYHCNTRVPHIYRKISVLAFAMSTQELIVSEILILAGAEVNDRECEATPLCRAVGSQEYTREKVVLLLNVGADPNLLTRARKETALHVAVREKKVEIVELLLERGADPNIANQYGKMPLDWAVGRNCEDIVELLQHWKKHEQD